MVFDFTHFMTACLLARIMSWSSGLELTVCNQFEFCIEVLATCNCDL